MSVRADPLTIGVRASAEHVLGGGPDLACTYAAVRTASWLGAAWELPAPVATVDYVLSLHRPDGGYAAAPGMRSELWATCMCTSVLRDLGVAVPHPASTLTWLSRLRDDGGFGMWAGQSADPWATYYGCRVATETCGITVPRDSLAHWLHRLQTRSGGLAWSPEAAAADQPDISATYCGVGAWLAAAPHDRNLPWRVDPLVGWLQGEQRDDGGFALAGDGRGSCLTATHLALSVLDALAAGPRDPVACLRWVLARRGRQGSFVRWEGYDAEDVWAAHHGVGALRLLGYPLDELREPVLRRLAEAACPGGGFTYREVPFAADALATALTVMIGDGPAMRARDWLDQLQRPDDGGVMYMPGGTAELRATLWAVCAGALSDSRRRVRAVRWLVRLQNADGGYGPWAGRSSDPVSTVNALELDRKIGYEGARVDRQGTAAFLSRFWPDENQGADRAEHGAEDGHPQSLRSLLQVARGLVLSDVPKATVRPRVQRALAEHASGSGGYADTPGALPDLLTCYEVALTAPWLRVAVDTQGLLYALDALRRPDGFAWTPAVAAGGGPLAYGLGSLLEEALMEDLRWPVPPLTLA